jgi:hypothetical protein
LELTDDDRREAERRLIRTEAAMNTAEAALSLDPYDLDAREELTKQRELMGSIQRLLAADEGAQNR